jgi:hypothetical protein
MERLAESVLDSGMTTEIRPGQTLENPVTGERFTFVHTAATTGGELLAFDLALRAGGAVPVPHVHPIQTERFEVVAGRCASASACAPSTPAPATSSRSRPASSTASPTPATTRRACASRSAPRWRWRTCSPRSWRWPRRAG